MRLPRRRRPASSGSGRRWTAARTRPASPRPAPSRRRYPAQRPGPALAAARPGDGSAARVAASGSARLRGLAPARPAGSRCAPGPPGAGGAVPGVELGGQLGRFLLVFGRIDFDLGLRRGERRDPPLGHRDAGGPRALPGRAAAAAPASRTLAAASVSASSAPVRITADDCPPDSVARHMAGMPAASSRARSASAPDSTGRHRAACPPSSERSAGSTRPRAARSAASRATAAR